MSEWREMTPLDWSLFVEGWNEAHASDKPQPPTWDQFEDLKAKYG
ncbi:MULTISPECIES: hypothetical protein [unclassified Sulfitobacter]|jgi:hypothetical protein|nr:MULTISPECIES: hypothetical protein [unclassified Sulfitobacter]